MRKATMHYILDAVEGIILLLLVVSGFILWFALPEGSAADKTVIFNRRYLGADPPVAGRGAAGFLQYSYNNPLDLDILHDQKLLQAF